ncbi:unnamed protein product [Medioppia subpectinata]|uniref:Cytochrome P450 n=1 Tax=Medioppia subpectinata TaxID=1979941 RepID=A0A7R9KEA4_9ACAR|nr:unnamed protein product [Medioppia subpectinata]CAG2101735.1 unnamed protein product [Medioppia subpectinata]
MGAKPTVLVADADLAKDIQIKDFHNFTDRANLKLKGGPFTEPLFDQTFLILRGKQWKKVRSVSTPTFSASKLKTMTPIIDDAFNNFIDIIDNRSKTGVEFDIYDIRFYGLCFERNAQILSANARECREDYKLNDTIVIPKGSSVVVDVHYLHHSPDYWSEPEVFDPMRFSADRKHEIYPNSWQPFGSGPRNCIGMRFALLVVKLSLAKLLLNYRLISGAKTETANLSLTTTIFTQSPRNGIFLKVTKL